MASLLLLSRQAPGLSLIFSSVDPIVQLMSSEQTVHVSFLSGFRYEPFSHTQVVLPSTRVVFFASQALQNVRFDAG
jgi:hypothetical protein